MRLHNAQYEVAPDTPSVLAKALNFCNAAAWLDVLVANTPANDIRLICNVPAVISS